MSPGLQTNQSPTWIADDSVLWNIALVAKVKALSSSSVDRRRALVNRSLGTPDQPQGLTLGLADLCARSGDEAVRTGLQGGRLTVVAQHRYLDGLGLLAALAELTDTCVSSSARGIGGTAEEDFLSSAGHRLAEVAFTPPAIVARLDGQPGLGIDSFAQVRVPGHFSSAQAVHAAAQAAVEFNRRHGARQRRARRSVAIAVGSSRRPGAAPVLGDHSALLRLTQVEELELAQIRDRLRHSTPAPSTSGAAATGVKGRLVGAALKVLGSRLGSTVLVSHLGGLEIANSEVSELDFYPVTAGASGVSLGLVEHQGATSVTARGRAAHQSESALAELVGLVADRLVD